MKRILVLIVVAGFILSAFSGCAKPPKAERELAEKSFKDASIGKDCDKENYLAAEELLNKAREQVNKKNYEYKLNFLGSGMLLNGVFYLL